MKLGFKGTDVRERLVLLTGLVPELAMLPFISMVVNNAVFTAQRLGLFELLETEPMTPSAIAARVDIDEHAAQVLLEALAGFGYLERTRGTFAISAELRKSLSGRMGEMARSMLEFAPDVARKFESLDEAVRTGDVSDFHFDPATPGQWQHYLSFLKLSAARPTKAITDKVRFDAPPKRMLDIAGGPAQYSIAFCEKYPDLEAVILDLPESAAAGNEEAAKVGMSERISYVVGNFFETQWGTDYDIALLSNMLHCLKADECRLILRRAFEALRPGAVIVTNEPGFPGDDAPIDTFAAYTSLLYFTVTGGRTHPTPAIEGWLRDAGFQDISMSTGGGQTQAIGQKPASS
ncbi:MAG: class I SAM-dependent methyltransferase [Pseudomonadota bacterium]